MFAAQLAMRKKVHTLLWVTFVLVTLLGGLTVWFHNPTFIKWKPSAVCWAMALVLLVSQLIGKNLLRTLVRRPDIIESKRQSLEKKRGREIEREIERRRTEGEA